MILFLGFLNTAMADTQLWMKTAYRWKAIPKTHFKATQHLRLEDNLTAIESIIPELEFAWRRIPWFDLGIGGRVFWRRTKNDTLELAQRIHLDIQRDWALHKKLEVSYRVRIQRRQEFDENDADYKLRNKINLEYDAPKKWLPNAFVEYHISADANDKFQLGVGTKYKINKSNRVGVKLVLETFVNTTPDNFISMLNYEYRQKKKKKKK